MPPLWYAGAFDYGRTKSMQFVDTYWNIANLFASQASYDASPSAGKTLLTQAVASALGITNAGGINGTYVDSSGNIATKTSGTAPRITFDRGAGSNLMASSDDFTAWLTNSASVSGGKLIEAVGSNTHYIYKAGTTVTAGIVTVFIDAKAAERPKLWLNVYDFVGNAGNWFDLTTGTVGGIYNGAGATTAGIIPMGGGVYRCWISATVAATSDFRVQVGCAPTESSTYIGDGTSGIYVYRGQVNRGSVPLTYLRTTTSALTTAGTPRSQNLLLQSNACSTSPWTASTLAVAQQTGTLPDGTTGTYWRLTAQGASSHLYQINNVGAVGCTYTNAVWVRRVTGSGTIDLHTPSNGSSPITVTGSWQLFSVPGTPASNKDIYTLILIATSGDAIDVCNFQVYEGTTAPTYVATTATPYSEYPQAGLLREVGRTNLALWCRDLTNAAWTASSVTVAKTATGIDGVANSASTLTASGANGTVLQAITSGSAARITSAYVRRKTGTGTVNMTQDNGTTWTVITPQAYWSQIPIPSATAANPTIGFRIVTSGDAIEVDYAQHELGAFVTSPIATTTASVTRDADLIRPPTTWINDTAQTTVVEFVPIKAAVSTGQRFLGRAGNVTPSYIETTAATGLYDSTNTALTANLVADNVPGRLATRYSAAGIGAVLNGGTIATSVFDGSMGTTGSTVGLGDDSAGSAGFSGLITRISIATRAANDADLQAASAGLM